MKKLVVAVSFLATQAIAVTYSVPVPAELASDALFSTTGVAKLKGKTLEVGYHLPEELVGKNGPGLHFTGTVTSQFVKVAGNGVNGVCMLSEAKPLSCMLKYPDLVIDTVSRDEVLRSKFFGDALNRRQKVAELFSNDPAGILSLEVK